MTTENKATPSLHLRQKILLIFLDTDKKQELDPIRIMKGLFLFVKEAPSNWLQPDARYHFEACNYGPCSYQIYTDLDILKAYGYVKSTVSPGNSWAYYSLTPEGHKLAQRLSDEINHHVVMYLKTIRNFVIKLSFRSLLEVVYKRYPDYAKNSAFKF
jgi:hypothetical protein